MGNVKILKASAGSGKTYQLAYAYIRNVIRDPGRYRHILAVTFTNKATEEMKQRIISEINRLACGAPDGYLPELVRDLELHYQNVLFIVYKLIGFYVKAEYHTSQGRIDLLLQTDKFIYVMEFKFEGTAEEALRQINEKNYALPFASDPRKLFKIGINFSNEMRNIDIVKLICKELGKPESLITHVTDRKGHDMRYAIDPAKIHNELGWLPETKFADGIKKTIRWYLDNREWWENIINGEYQNYYERMYGNR